MIDIQNVTFSYKGNQPLVFDEFSLCLEQNRIYGLLGENGTGKSTLLYLMMGLLRPVRGRVMVDGIETISRSRELLQNMYIVPEEFKLPDMLFADYVKTYRPFYPQFSDELLRYCLSEFHLQPDMHIGRLSMGDKKKILMSFALATNARYLLMDEPTNGLDLLSKKQFRKVVVTSMSEERMILIATHQLHDVEQLLDHVLILRCNDILLNQSVTSISEQYTFDVRPDEYLDDAVLYTERSVQGNHVICRRQTHDEETSLNLELLYNAVMNEKLK